MSVNSHVTELNSSRREGSFLAVEDNQTLSTQTCLSTTVWLTTDTDTQLAPHSCDITGIRSHDRMLGKQMRQKGADESLVKARAGVLCCHPPWVHGICFYFSSQAKSRKGLDPSWHRMYGHVEKWPKRTGLMSRQRDPFSTTQGEFTLRNTLLFAWRECGSGNWDLIYCLRVLSL